MSLKRNVLKDLGLESDVIDKIISLHTETLEGVKTDLEKVNEDLKVANAKIKDFETNKSADIDMNDYVKKTEYEELQTSYNDYKNEIADKEILANKKSAYINQVLKAENINDKRHESILKLFDFGKLELDEDGQIKDLDTLKESAKTEWADFVTKTETKGTSIANPPAQNNQEDPFLQGFDE